MEFMRERFMSNNKIKSLRILWVALFISFTMMTIYVHIQLVNSYRIDKIPLIENIEDLNSKYYMPGNSEKTLSYDDIFIAKGTQDFMDIKHYTYNKNRLENFKDTYLMCKSDEHCIKEFREMEMVNEILNSWKNYYEDFEPNK